MKRVLAALTQRVGPLITLGGLLLLAGGIAAKADVATAMIVVGAILLLDTIASSILARKTP